VTASQALSMHTKGTHAQWGEGGMVRRIFCPMTLGGLGNDWLEFFESCPFHRWLNFHFSASNS